MLRGVRRAASFGAALCFLLSAGCDTRDPVVRMQDVQGPPGGSVFTITAAEGDEQTQVAAPTEFALYLHDGAAWSAVDAQILPSFRLLPFHDLHSGDGQFSFPMERRFTGWNGRLWMINLEGALSEPALYMSSDVGRTWQPVPLPATSDPGEVEITDPFRLLATPSTLYLLHTRHLWRLVEEDGTSWIPISLDGVTLETEDGELPPAIRNYLPRSASRPFEILTVLKDQLMVYRRSAAGEPWVLTSTLGMIDRQIIGTPKSETIFVLSRDALYRSDDQAEQWFRAWPAELDAQLTVATVVTAPDLEPNFALLVGARDGTILRASLTATDWKEAYTPPAPFGISGFAVDSLGRLWASTLGGGAVYSDNRGLTWNQTRTGLRATAPLDIDLRSDGSLVVASDAGVFQKAGDPAGDEWTQLHPFPSASVAYDPVGNRVVSGGFDGRIRSTDPGGTTAAEPLPLGSTISPMVRPSRLDRIQTEPETISEVVAGPFGPVALSHQNGGAEWRDDAWVARDFPPALASALSSSEITFLTPGDSTTLFLAERSDARGTPTQVWRSNDAGETWSATHSFPPLVDRTRTFIEQRSKQRPNHLLAAHGPRLWQTLDGDAWTNVPGPWNEGTIVGFDLRADTAALMVHFERHTRLFVWTGLEDRDAMSRFELILPERARSESIREIAFLDRRLWVATTRGIYTGVLPSGSGRYDGIDATITTIALMLGIVIGFGILRIWGR